MEERDYRFFGKKKVPKEIKDVKNSPIRIMGIRLDLKELLMSMLGIIIFVAVFFLVHIFFGTIHLPGAISGTLGGLAGVMAASPVFIYTFVKPHGMEFRDWLLVRRSNRASSPVRKNNGMNEYEKLEDLYDRIQKRKKKGKGKKKTKTKVKKKKTKQMPFL